jgi:hypothetical protein
MMSTQTITEDKARDIGREHGESAASWIFDGNTPDSTYSAILKMIDDGDTALYDTYREPSLSGEFSGDYDETSLASDISYATGNYDLDIDDLARHYNDSASESFWAELERLAREHMST